MATATLSYNLNDLIGEDFDPRRTKVWITANVPLIVVDGTTIRLDNAPSQSPASDGTGSFTLVTTNSAINPTSFAYVFHVDYALKGRQGNREQWHSSEFTFTTSANIATISEAFDGLAIAPTWQSEFRAEMEEIAGLTGEDAAIANRINTPGSNTETALLNKIDASGAGVRIDGYTTADAQAAADAALVLGTHVFAPAGTYVFDAPVSFKVPLRCAPGAVFQMATNDADARIEFVRDSTATVLTATGLGGMTQGSTAITGTGGAVGTLVLTSTEELIKRNGSGGAAYTKREVATLSEGGIVSPPLAHTYSDLTKLTAEVYPPDVPIAVDGLTVELAGAALTTRAEYVLVQRSGVTFDRLRVINDTGLAAVTAVAVRSAVGTTFHRPRIHGFMDSGSGYGILDSQSASTVINDAEITKCRHPVTGVYHKDFTVNRGRFEGEGLDSHWVTGMHLNDVLNIVGAGYSHVQVAGKDVFVRGGEFRGGRNIVGVRNDTPELAGTLELSDATWTMTPGSANYWAVGYTSTSSAFFDFGRTLTTPSVVKIRNIQNASTTADTWYVLHCGDRAYPHTYWTGVDISDVRTAGTGPIIAYYQDKYPAQHTSDTVGPAARISRIDFGATLNDNIIVNNSGDTSDAKDFNIVVDDCGRIAIKIPENAISTLLVRNSSVRRLFRSAASAQPVEGDFRFDRCTFDSASFNGLFLVDFWNNIWKGTTTSSNLTIDARTKSYRGNLVTVGTTGAPTVADGYKNATYYA